MLKSQPASDKSHRRRETEEVGCLIRQDSQACRESRNQSMALKLHAFEQAARALDTRVGLRFSGPDSVTAESKNQKYL